MHNGGSIAVAFFCKGGRVLWYFPVFTYNLALANEMHDLPTNTDEKLKEKIHLARRKYTIPTVVHVTTPLKPSM